MAKKEDASAEGKGCGYNISAEKGFFLRTIILEISLEAPSLNSFLGGRNWIKGLGERRGLARG